MKRTLVVNTTHGLGNQLFQYAAGMFFEREWQASSVLLPPAVEHRESEGYPRPFQLDQFRLSRAIATPNRWNRFIQSANLHGSAERMRRSLALWTGVRMIRETQLYHFREIALPENAKRIYLRGYWQAWRYAAEVEVDLRRELQWKEPLAPANSVYAQTIASSINPVSVHLRRGDYTLYTSGEGAAKRGLVLDLSYYRQAFAALRSRIGTFTPVVFSDDPAFARTAITEPGSIFVEGNDALTATEDLRLMAMCRHHVIANSTFSWWGAWLNPAPDKLVCAPRFWTNQPDSYYPDLLPPEWLAIDNIAGF